MESASIDHCGHVMKAEDRMFHRGHLCNEQIIRRPMHVSAEAVAFCLPGLEFDRPSRGMVF
jgi:hypothetical protein